MKLWFLSSPTILRSRHLESAPGWEKSSAWNHRKSDFSLFTHPLSPLVLRSLFTSTWRLFWESKTSSKAAAPAFGTFSPESYREMCWYANDFWCAEYPDSYRDIKKNARLIPKGLQIYKINSDTMRPHRGRTLWVSPKFKTVQFQSNV